MNLQYYKQKSGHAEEVRNCQARMPMELGMNDQSAKTFSKQQTDWTGEIES